MKRIKKLPLFLRPREKLLKNGAEGLSLEELISVILITGTKTLPVSKIATCVAPLFDKLNQINKNSLQLLGLTSTKIAQILSVCELIQRFNNIKPAAITSAKQIYALSHGIISSEKESLICFYLNGRNELLKKEIIAVGSLNRANLLPREIFHLIKELPVASIILVHNHPSSNLEPSEQDLIFTKRVKLSADLLGIKLLDHLIVTKQGWKRIEFK